MNFHRAFSFRSLFFVALNDFICRLKGETNRYATRSVDEARTNLGRRTDIEHPNKGYRTLEERI